MLTEYEARHRQRHIRRYVEGAPCILLKCLVLAAIAVALLILGSATRDDGSSVTSAIKAVRPCHTE